MYLSARTPANATTSRRATVVCCFVHMDHLPPPLLYATRGTDEGKNKKQDINSSIRSAAPPPASTGLGEPAQPRETTTPLRNCSPLGPRKRTSTRSAVDQKSPLTVPGRERKPRLPAANNKFHGYATGFPRTFRTRGSRKQNDAHSESHNTCPPVRHEGINFSPASNIAHDTARRTVA